jgi:hypothetical protein
MAENHKRDREFAKTTTGKNKIIISGAITTRTMTRISTRLFSDAEAFCTPITEHRAAFTMHIGSAVNITSDEDTSARSRWGLPWVCIGGYVYFSQGFAPL